jgi:hypothetical protein
MSAGTAGTVVQAQDIADIVPVTNPFLKDMLETFLKAGGRRGGIDFDELGIQDVVELLRGDETDLPEILRDFGNKNPDEDPVIHFYEHFLSAYNKQLKVERGVFYTPSPVVSYIVRSVHEFLQTEFGLPDGLASTVTWGEMIKQHPNFKLPPLTDEPGEKRTIDPAEPFVQILDIATGTATFIVEVIDVVHRTMTAKWRQAGQSTAQIQVAWNEYVPKHLLPRVYGFELMMAPYAIAHMKVGLKLFETGYHFGFEERVRIYLTNSLEPKVRQLPQIGFDALAREAKAVNEVKWYKRFTVIIGNPPYAGHSQNNEIQWIVDLVKDFTREDPSLQGPGQGKWLQDDYVKFLRFAQHLVSAVPVGVIGMITNHRYLTNRTFRGMRKQWLDFFPSIHLLDLHGNRVVHEVSPLGYDENVFDIEQGVSIGCFARTGAKPIGACYAELWGDRMTQEKTGKYDFLSANVASSTPWQTLKPQPPMFLLAPREQAGEDLSAEFYTGLSMHQLMPGALGPNGKPPSGLATMHDNFAASFTVDELKGKSRQFLATKSREEAKDVFGNLCNPQQWDYAVAKAALSGKSWQDKISTIYFAPFDTRYTVYDNAVAVHLRRRISDHLFGRKNLALVIGEAGQEISGDDWDAVSCVNGLLQLNYFRRNGSPTLPLYLYDEAPELLSPRGRVHRRPNFNANQLKLLANKLGLKQGQDGLPEGLSPEHFPLCLRGLSQPRVPESLRRVSEDRFPATAADRQCRVVPRTGPPWRRVGIPPPAGITQAGQTDHRTPWRS